MWLHKLWDCILKIIHNVTYFEELAVQCTIYGVGGKHTTNIHKYNVRRKNFDVGKIGKFGK